MAVYSLDEILRLIIEWEKKLLRYYTLMEKYLARERSKKTIEALKRQQIKTLVVLGKINIKDYKKTEYLKNVPDSHSVEVIVPLEISKDSQPQEIFEKILNYEEKLEEYYQHIRGVLAYAKSKELFDMLIQFKLGQIKRIKSYMDSYDLVM